METLIDLSYSTWVYMRVFICLGWGCADVDDSAGVPGGAFALRGGESVYKVYLQTNLFVYYNILLEL